MGKKISFDLSMEDRRNEDDAETREQYSKSNDEKSTTADDVTPEVKVTQTVRFMEIVSKNQFTHIFR